MRTFLTSSALMLFTGLASVSAQDDAAALSGKLHQAVQDNSSIVRLKLEFNSQAGEKVVLQIQAKARRTASATDILYQVLWPKERKGEGFVLRKVPNQAASGSVFTLPDNLRSLTAAQMQEGLFGSALAYEDLVDGFYGWPSQQIVGRENIGRVACHILESKPGKSDRTSYSSVRSWIDVKRMVPVRIEKLGSGGQLIRRITTTRIAKDDINRQVPATFTVHFRGQESETVLEGSNSKHDVSLTDADFAPEALRNGVE
jgi:hypothetical protein